MVVNKFVLDACDWFIKFKSLDLEPNVRISIDLIKDNKPIEYQHKKLLAFILFDYTMHKGPQSFCDAEKCANELNVMNEFRWYANDWIEYYQKRWWYGK